MFEITFMRGFEGHKAGESCFMDVTIARRLIREKIARPTSEIRLEAEENTAIAVIRQREADEATAAEEKAKAEAEAKAAAEEEAAEVAKELAELDEAKALLKEAKSAKDKKAAKELVANAQTKVDARETR